MKIEHAKNNLILSPRNAAVRAGMKRMSRTHLKRWRKKCTAIWLYDTKISLGNCGKVLSRQGRSYVG